MALLPGKGDGTFDPVLMFPIGGEGADSVALGNLNTDGLSDLVVANKNGGTIGVLLNASR